MFCLVLVSAFASASTQRELADLDRLAREIRFVARYAEQIQSKHSDSTDPIRFRYERVIQTLDRLEQNIQAHIEYANRAARSERYAIE